MGATFVTKSFKACEVSVLRQDFKEYQQDCLYEGGHDVYNGHMGHARGLNIVDRVFKDDEQAYTWLQDQTSKYGPAIAVKVGEFKPIFPVTQKDKKMVEDLKAIDREVNEFELDVLKRAKAQKSAKRTCSHCGSSISLKHLEVPKVIDAERFSAAIPGMVQFCGEYNLVVIRKLTACPVCNHNFLITETDKKRKVALVAKQKELSKKVNDSLTAYARKIQGKQGYWLVGACVPE